MWLVWLLGVKIILAAQGLGNIFVHIFDYEFN